MIRVHSRVSKSWPKLGFSLKKGPNEFASLPPEVRKALERMQESKAVKILEAPAPSPKAEPAPEKTLVEKLEPKPAAPPQGQQAGPSRKAPPQRPPSGE